MALTSFPVDWLWPSVWDSRIPVIHSLKRQLFYGWMNSSIFFYLLYFFPIFLLYFSARGFRFFEIFFLPDNFISSPFFLFFFHSTSFFCYCRVLFVAIYPRVCELFCANGNAQCLKVWVPPTNHHPATLSDHPIPKDDDDGDADGQSRRRGWGGGERKT
jgi:hypothetical protein